jgi:hypothetical protein
MMITVSRPNYLLLGKLKAAQHVKKFVEGSQPCSENPVLMKTKRLHFFKPYVFKIQSILLQEYNGNLRLGLIKYDSTKVYGEVEKKLHVFFTSKED